MQSTEWRDVLGYEKSYEVSNMGEVRSLDRILQDGHRWKGRTLKLVSRKGFDGADRTQVTLHFAGRQRTRLVHRLVLDAFVGPRPEGTEGCHWDGDPANNRLDNLRWATHLDNEADKARHGTHHNTMKTHCPQGHLLAGLNLMAADVRRGFRKCRACNLTHTTAFKRGVSFTKEDSDARYADVMAGRVGVRKAACKRGHLLVEPNLIACSLRDGVRACKACSSAKGYARTHGLPFDAAHADMRYARFMESAR